MVGPDGEFMTGSYVIMDGGIRDAGAAWEPAEESMAELEKLAQASEERNARMQALIDER